MGIVTVVKRYAKGDEILHKEFGKDWEEWAKRRSWTHPEYNLGATRQM